MEPSLLDALTKGGPYGLSLVLCVGLGVVWRAWGGERDARAKLQEQRVDEMARITTAALALRDLSDRLEELHKR